MKKRIVKTIVAISLCIGMVIPAYATETSPTPDTSESDPYWNTKQEDGSYKPMPENEVTNPQGTQETNGTTSSSSSIDVYGAIGNLEDGGLDIDGDGTPDLIIGSTDLINVSVPMEAYVVTSWGAQGKKVIAPEYKIRNESSRIGNSVQVSVSGINYVENAAIASPPALAQTKVPANDSELSLWVSADRNESTGTYPHLGDENPFHLLTSDRTLATASVEQPIVLGDLATTNEVSRSGYFTFGADYTETFIDNYQAALGSNSLKYKLTYRVDIKSAGTLPSLQ